MNCTSRKAIRLATSLGGQRRVADSQARSLYLHQKPHSSPCVVLLTYGKADADCPYCSMTMQSCPGCPHHCNLHACT